MFIKTWQAALVCAGCTITCVIVVFLLVRSRACERLKVTCMELCRNENEPEKGIAPVGTVGQDPRLRFSDSSHHENTPLVTANTHLSSTPPHLVPFPRPDRYDLDIGFTESKYRLQLSLEDTPAHWRLEQTQHI